MRKTIQLGKIDYNRCGRRDCMVTVDIELKDTDKGPVFSVCADIWNPKMTSIYCSGQCLDTIKNFLDSRYDADSIMSVFPKYDLFLDIYDLWSKYHLNDMRAGDREQEAEVRRFLNDEHYDYDYDLVCEHLKDFNLYVHNGYRYGSSWCYEEIPQKDLNKIRTLL